MIGAEWYNLDLCCRDRRYVVPADAPAEEGAEESTGDAVNDGSRRYSAYDKRICMV